MVLSAHRFYLTIVTAVILISYGIGLCIMQPYDAKMDFGLDIANLAVALGALALSEYMVQTKGKPSTFVTGCLWLNMLLMIGFTVQGAWPLLVLLQESLADHMHKLLVCVGLRSSEHDHEEEIKKVIEVAADVKSGTTSTLPARLIKLKCRTLASII